MSKCIIPFYRGVSICHCGWFSSILPSGRKSSNLHAHRFPPTNDQVIDTVLRDLLILFWLDRDLLRIDEYMRFDIELELTQSPPQLVGVVFLHQRDKETRTGTRMEPIQRQRTRNDQVMGRG